MCIWPAKLPKKRRNFSLHGSDAVFGAVTCGDANRYGDEVGTPRTSTKPKLVDPLDGLTIMQVAMGYGHSLLLAR